VRMRRAAFLLFCRKARCLGRPRSVEMPYLGRDPLQRAGYQRQAVHEVSRAGRGAHLRRDESSEKTKPLRDVLLDLSGEWCVSSTATAHPSDRRFVCARASRSWRAVEIGDPAGPPFGSERVMSALSPLPGCARDSHQRSPRWRHRELIKTPLLVAAPRRVTAATSPAMMRADSTTAPPSPCHWVLLVIRGARTASVRDGLVSTVRTRSRRVRRGSRLQQSCPPSKSLWIFGSAEKL